MLFCKTAMMLTGMKNNMAAVGDYIRTLLLFALISGMFFLFIYLFVYMVCQKALIIYHI